MVIFTLIDVQRSIAVHIDVGIDGIMQSRQGTDRIIFRSLNEQICMHIDRSMSISGQSRERWINVQIDQYQDPLDQSIYRQICTSIDLCIDRSLYIERSKDRFANADIDLWTNRCNGRYQFRDRSQNYIGRPVEVDLYIDQYIDVQSLDRSI